MDRTPQLPLDVFRALMGLNPWHFWGWADDDGLRVTSSCNPVLTQYAWQGHDAPGRADIAESLIVAEDRWLQWTRFAPIRRYTEDTIQYPKLTDGRMRRRVPADADARWLSLQLPEWYVVAVGVEANDAIVTDAAVIYSDDDGDGYTETATIGPLTTTVTDPTEVVIYHAALNRYHDPVLSDRWRIRPLTITLSGGQVTITAPAWLFARPIRYEGVTPQPLDPSVSTNFVDTVDVYRRYTNTTGTTTATAQAVITWETRPCHGWWCGCAACGGGPTPAYGGSVDDPAATATALARCGVRDSDNGIISAAEAIYDVTAGVWRAAWAWDEPDRVTVRYLAGGDVDRHGEMLRGAQHAIVRLAAADMPRDICGCAEANRRLQYWQQDLAKTGNEKELFTATPAQDLNNPLGTRRGHIYAWNEIIRVGRAIGYRI